MQSRYNTQLYNSSKVSEKNGNENTSFRKVESWTKCPNDWKISKYEF